jgi:hypothetical protein
MIFPLKKYTRLFLIFVFICSVLTAALFKHDIIFAMSRKIPRIELKGGSIYLDGEKFFIKGIGYSPYRPGKWPGSHVSREILEADFKRIKEAGFNTLRVWVTMPEEQLKLAEKYGLKVIQAVYLKPGADFGYSGYIRSAESKVKQMCKVSRRRPNVIMYSLMNEPHAESIIDSGVDNTLNLYKRLIKLVRQEDPKRPITMANAHWNMWLDQSIWDVVSFNAYTYFPLLIPDIGYANYVKSLKLLHAADKPLVVTEFGLSVSPEGKGGGNYGGNTEKEQVDGLIYGFRGLVEGGAAGGCVFEWNDEWWKADNPAIHEPHPEEWFGIIGIENINNPIGTPRKAYYSIREELKLVVTEPKEGYRMVDKADIEVSASQEVSGIQYSIDGEKWIDLSKKNNWWYGTVDGSHIKPGLHKLTVKGLDNGEYITRELNIIKCKNEKEASLPINIELITDKAAYKNGEIIKINARLTDRDGAPLKDQYVKLGVFNSTDTHLRRWEGYTDKDGCFAGSIPVIGNLSEWYYIYWVGTEIEEYGYKKKEGKLDYVKAEFGEGFPKKWAIAKEVSQIKIDGKMEDEWMKAGKIAIDANTNYMEGEIDSSEDLSADAKVLWDESNIYILARVNDDIPMRNKNRHLDLWDGDCIELFISVDPAKIPERGYSNSDFQILIGTNGEMWIPGQTIGGVRNKVPVLSEAAAKSTDTGYILEARINIANFYDKPSLKQFKKGDELGFEIAIGDGDAKGVREGKLVWNGTPQGYKHSAVWGRLKLE